jgi:2-dehydropantoate 2-reductase
MTTRSNTIVIGNGRLAKHLIHWCKLLDYPVTNIKRSDELNLTGIEYVWLAISDSSLISFYEEKLRPQLKNQKVIHFSGSVHHPDMISAHPLMTFSHELYDLGTYHQIQFALTGADCLFEALPPLKNNYFKISAEHKELYHALCVMAGNLPQILWSKTQPLFADLKIPPQALQPYLQKSLENFFTQGPKALTGPIVRGDVTTIEKNLSALEKVNPQLQTIYKGFLT